MAHSGGTDRRPRSILILRLSAIGDVVCTLPLLGALRNAFPEAAVDWLVERKAADVVAGHPDLRTVFVVERMALGTLSAWFAPLRELRRRRYDVVLDVQGSAKSALPLLAARSERSIGFARGYSREGSRLLVREHVTPPGLRIHRVDKNLALLGALGVEGPHPRTAPIPVDPRAAERVVRRIEEEKLPPDRLALLHPGTSAWGLDKQWPGDRFADLARRLAEEAGLAPVVTWGPGERSLAERIAAASGGRARPCFETSSLAEFIALIARASLFVSADTGAMQVASFLGRPTVAIYGPTDPVIYGPLGPRSAVVRPPGQSGPPPTRDRSRRSDLMQSISVDRVLEAVLRVLDAAD